MIEHVTKIKQYITFTVLHERVEHMLKLQSSCTFTSDGTKTTIV